MVLFRCLVAIAGAALVAGCEGAVHRLPQVESGELRLAESEIWRDVAPPPRVVTGEQALEEMNSALRRILPAAQKLCLEMRTGVCAWRFYALNRGELNAAAHHGGVIVVDRGVVEYAESEDEIAVVIAHEIGHQAANHMATGARNQSLGALAGRLLLGTLSAVVSYDQPGGAVATHNAAALGSWMGGSIGRVAYTKEQEREADYLAAVILYRAGLDLDKARGVQLKMARMSERHKTGLWDSHPAGPERLAAWDRAVREIRASQGRLPQRAS